MCVDLSVAELVGSPDLDHHFVVIAPDITHMVEQQLVLEQMANTDVLTRLPNRRSGQMALDIRMLEAVDSGQPLSLAMADIDRFKDINDRLGHGVGDEVLRVVATTLAHTMRATDTAIRWGGEEFLILLPRTGIDDAAVLAERIRHAIEEMAGPSGRVTMSFGVGQNLPGESAHEFVSRVDAALYVAKETGRNRVAQA